MKIVSIEPTPSPNSMKLNMDFRLPDGARYTYSHDNLQTAPDYAQKLLAIPGVKSLFHAVDFIALDRHSRGDWQQILENARDALGTIASGHEGVNAQIGMAKTEAIPQDSGWGEVIVRVQTFRHIPMQIRVSNGKEEQRAALSERFIQAATQASMASSNLIKERKLEEYGVRYGELFEVLEQIAIELEAAYDESKLALLVKEAMKDSYGQNEPDQTVNELKPMTPDQAAVAMTDPDWRKRFAVLRSLPPTLEAVSIYANALNDPQMSIRRMATVYLGDLKDPIVLPYLYQALLHDSSPAVRRTAGDTLSDLGYPEAIGAVIQSLQDSSKIVRWRAARFLYEVGDQSAVDALRAVQNDPEFEVSMQLKLALERIEGGEAAIGSVWQQMTQRSKQNRP